MTGRRQTTALAGGAAASGLLAYAVFARHHPGLGAGAAAPASVLWTWWGFTGAALSFPLQHWVTRTVSAHGERSVRSALPRVGLGVLVLSAATGALAWLAREPLFHSDDGWFPAMVALVTLGSALIGVARGGLGARERYAAVGASLVAENAVRLVGVVALRWPTCGRRWPSVPAWSRARPARSSGPPRCASAPTVRRCRPRGRSPSWPGPASASWSRRSCSRPRPWCSRSPVGRRRT